MFKKINLFIVLSTLICFLGTANIYAQSHGLPSSFDIMSRFHDFIPEGKDGWRLQTGAYYSNSNRFFMTNSSIVTPTSYKDWTRIGIWTELQKRIGDNFLVSFQLPVQKSSAYNRVKVYYTTQDYNTYIIGDYKLTGGWQIAETPKYLLYADISYILAAPSKRAAFADPYVYVGLDGHNALSTSFAGSFMLTPDLSLMSKISYLNTFSRKRVTVEGGRALAISNNKYNSISAVHDPRDIIDFSIIANFKLEDNLRVMLGFERWYETEDKTTDIESGGDTAIEDSIKSIADGGEGHVHYLLGGVSFPFYMDTQATLTYKQSLSGQYAYAEQQFSFSVEHEF